MIQIIAQHELGAYKVNDSMYYPVELSVFYNCKYRASSLSVFYSSKIWIFVLDIGVGLKSEYFSHTYITDHKNASVV